MDSFCNLFADFLHWCWISFSFYRSRKPFVVGDNKSSYLSKLAKSFTMHLIEFVTSCSHTQGSLSYLGLETER